MNSRTLLLTQSLFAAAFLLVQSPPADEEALRKDLTSVIALQGLPCGQVVSVKVQAEMDYAALCHDEHRYRVYMNAAGRVVVEAQK